MIFKNKFIFKKKMLAIIAFSKKLDNSVAPVKAGSDEVGYDLVAVKECKKYGKNTTMFDTGICVQPKDGFYTEIIARSSIVKTGYVLANSVGIIDPTYRGTLRICLTKVDNTLPDLKVPFNIAQLIVRPIIKSEMVEVEELDETNRGSGGFGSTNKN